MTSLGFCDFLPPVLSAISAHFVSNFDVIGHVFYWSYANPCNLFCLNVICGSNLTQICLPVTLLVLDTQMTDVVRGMLTHVAGRRGSSTACCWESLPLLTALPL